MKRIWIDLDNSPHVLFFAPVIRLLELQGFEVMVTVRNFSQTIELAESHGLKFRVVGKHHTPKSMPGRVLATLTRAAQLAVVVRGSQIDAAVSHGSRAMVLAARARGIRTMTLYDYEYISSGIFQKLSQRILVPQCVFDAMAPSARSRYAGYPGLKEEMYVHDFRPQRQVVQDLSLDIGRLIITVRPPAEWAHYHSPHSEGLFAALVERLREESAAQVVILSRTGDQARSLRAKFRLDSAPFIMPEKAVDALSLMWFSDAVFSGGGTMVREAAALGVPVFSIFAGRLGAADQSLVLAGRLRMLQDCGEIRGLAFRKRDGADGRLPSSSSTRDFIVEQISLFAGEARPVVASQSSA